MAFRKGRDEGLGIEIRGHQDQAIDASTHRAHGTCNLPAVAMGAGNEQMVPLRRAAASTPRMISEKIAVEIGKQDAGVLVLLGETARTNVRSVSQPGRDIPDSCSSLRERHLRR